MWLRASLISSRRSTARASRSCSSSRTPTWLCASPMWPTCWRPARSPCRVPGESCSTTNKSRRPIWAKKTDLADCSVRSIFLFMLGHDLDPIAIGIGDEVDPHGRVFKADAAHVLVLLVQLLVLIGVEGQVELALAQVVGLLAVPQPGQLQLKLGETVPQVHQTEGAVLGVLHPHRLQTQGLFIEVQALVQIQDIEVEVVEFDHKSFSFYSSSNLRTAMASKQSPFRSQRPGGHASLHFLASPFPAKPAYPQGARRIRKAAQPPTAVQTLGFGGRAACGGFFYSSSSLRTAIKASVGICTVPRLLIFFLPSFCFSSSFFLRVMSPP